MKQEPYVSHHSRSLQDSQIQNALRHKKDAVNFEKMVTEASNLEEEFVGKLKIEEVQVHVHQEQQYESTLQALVKKVEELEGVIKKRQNRTHMKQRKEPAMIVAYLDISHLIATKTLTLRAVGVNRRDICLCAAGCV